MSFEALVREVHVRAAYDRAHHPGLEHIRMPAITVHVLTAIPPAQNRGTEELWLLQPLSDSLEIPTGHNPEYPVSCGVVRALLIDACVELPATVSVQLTAQHSMATHPVMVDFFTGWLAEGLLPWLAISDSLQQNIIVASRKLVALRDMCVLFDYPDLSLLPEMREYPNALPVTMYVNRLDYCDAVEYLRRVVDENIMRIPQPVLPQPTLPQPAQPPARPSARVHHYVDPTRNDAFVRVLTDGVPIISAERCARRGRELLRVCQSLLRYAATTDQYGRQAVFPDQVFDLQLSPEALAAIVHGLLALTTSTIHAAQLPPVAAPLPGGRAARALQFGIGLTKEGVPDV